jgi:hypothetical protein
MAPALRQAAQRGRLHAVQGGDGIWPSSRKAIAELPQHAIEPSVRAGSIYGGFQS